MPWCAFMCCIIWSVDSLTFLFFLNLYCLLNSSWSAFLRYSCLISTGLVISLFAIFYLLCRIFRLFSSRYLIPLITETLLLRMSNVFKYSLLVFFSLLGRLSRFYLFNVHLLLFFPDNFFESVAIILVSFYSSNFL